MTSLWRLCREQYDRVLRIAGTALAERLMLLFAVLESIMIPIPVDPLLVATVLARPAKWIRLTAGCTIASVIGGGIGWALGGVLGIGIEEILAMMPQAVAAPANSPPCRTALSSSACCWCLSAPSRPCPTR